jgi:transcriptional regulator with XRE-family HTH domain
MEQLQAWLLSSGTRQSALAARLEITRGYMSELVAGRKLPSLQLAFRLEDETAGAVPARCWTAMAEADATPTPEPKEAA